MPMAASRNVKALNTMNATNHAPRHDPLLTVDVKFYVPQTKSIISVKALFGSGASAPAMSPELSKRLGCQETSLFK